MSSTSNATEVTEDHTKNTAIDRRAVQESGQQVIDSIIVDQSPQVVRDTMETLLSSWESMVFGNALNLQEVSALGGQILKYADKSQIQMSQVAYQTLSNGLDEFELMMRQGTRTLEVVEDISTYAIEANSDISSEALNVVAEVATGDAADNLKVISMAVMVFALGAIYLATKD